MFLCTKSELVKVSQPPRAGFGVRLHHDHRSLTTDGSKSTTICGSVSLLATSNIFSPRTILSIANWPTWFTLPTHGTTSTVDCTNVESRTCRSAKEVMGIYGYEYMSYMLLLVHLPEKYLVSGLCAELELIRGIVCHACKERISPRNFAQHPSTFSTQNLIVAPVELHNMGSQQTSALPSPHTITEAPVTSPFLSSDVRNALSRQTNLQNAQQTSFLPPSSTPTTHTCSPPMSNILASSEPAESFFIRPRTPLDVDSAVVDQPIIQKSPWSVMYNSEINQMLEITFIHAFNHSSSALSVRFSPDGNFLAAGLTCDLGRIHIYDVRTMSLEWYIFSHVTNSAKFLNSLYLVPWQNILAILMRKNILQRIYFACVSVQMADTWLLEVHLKKFTLVSFCPPFRGTFLSCISDMGHCQ